MSTIQLSRHESLTGFQSPSIPVGVPLLQYTDSTTFFIQGSRAAAHTLSTMMDIFSDFFGLKLNREKLSFIGFGLSPEELTGCSPIFATPTGTLPIRYLGLPLVDRRLHTQDWQPVLEKVESCLAGWRARFLSRGGGGGGGAPCAPQGSPNSHTYIFYVHLQDASRGTHAFGVEHERFLLARPPK